MLEKMMVPFDMNEKKFRDEEVMHNDIHDTE